MDILYTSFLQKLVQASNIFEKRVSEKALLKLLSFLSLKLKEAETLKQNFF